MFGLELKGRLCEDENDVLEFFDHGALAIGPEMLCLWRPGVLCLRRSCSAVPDVVHGFWDNIDFLERAVVLALRCAQLLRQR